MATGTNAIKTAKPVAGGGVFVAPIGTTLPTSYDAPLNAAFKPLGYLSEEGVTRTEENESDDKIAWGGDAVGDLPGNHTVSYAGTFLEGRNAETLKALRGAENVVVDSATGAITVKGNAKRPPRAVYVIDTDSVREVIMNAQISVSGDVQYVHNEVIQYEATWKAYPDSNGDKYFTYFPGDGSGSAPAAWSATTAYALGDDVTVAGGTLEATTAGTSGSTAPTAPASVGGTVTDGTVTWTRTA